MNQEHPRTNRRCQVCGSEHLRLLRPAAVVRQAVAELILRETGKWDESGWICLDDIHRFQHRYVAEVLKAEKGELTQLDREVLESLQTQETLSANADEEIDATLNLGQKLADRLAAFGGSWGFLTIFGVIIVAWMFLNSYSRHDLSTPIPSSCSIFVCRVSPQFRRR